MTRANLESLKKRNKGVSETETVIERAKSQLSTIKESVMGKERRGKRGVGVKSAMGRYEKEAGKKGQEGCKE